VANAEGRQLPALRAHVHDDNYRAVMRPRRITKLLSTALALIVLAAAWLYLAPVQLGGSASYVVTHGISMEPRFHTGDLAIVRSQSSYHVGEIVAYHSHKLHTIVLHRIIGREGDKYIFKGDNNNFIDPERPVASQMIGALWLHIPGAGVRLQSIRSPAVMGGLIFLGFLLLTGGVFTQRRRRRHREQRVSTGIPQPSRHLLGGARSPVVGVLAIGLLALVPFIALALLAFTRPLTTRRPLNIPYKQSGTLSYSADASPGPAYPTGHVTTGEPLFTNVLRAANVRFGYQFEGITKHAIAGTASLSATLTSTNGWHRTLALGRPTYFRGDRGVVTGTLDLAALVALIDSVEATTKVRGSYALAIIPRVNANGRVGPAPLVATFAPEIKFSVVEGEVKPEGTAESSGARASTGQGSTSGSGSSSTNQFAPSSTSSVTGSQVEPTPVPLGIVRPSVATARTLALGGIAIILGALMAILALLRPLLARFAPRQQGESADIIARYGEMIIPVARVSQLPGVAVIDVADMDALVRIAEHYDRSILHETDLDGDAFWVADESGQFRYTVGESRNAVDGQLVQQIPQDLRFSEAQTEELDLGGLTAVLDVQAIAGAYDAAPAEPAAYEQVAYDPAEPAPYEPRVYDDAPAPYEPADFQPAAYDAAFYEPAQHEQAPQPAGEDPAALPAAYDPAAYGSATLQPIYEQPAYQPAANQPVAYVPAYESATPQPGIIEPSAYDQATYQPVYQSATYEPATHQPAAYEPAAYDPAAYAPAACDPAEAITQDWPRVDDGVDANGTAAMAAFAPITGSDWT
jgi:signal peptidase I